MNGVGGAPVFIPGLILLSKNIRIVDPNVDELTANDISSAINNLSLDVGEFIGPIVGGFFTAFLLQDIILNFVVLLFFVLVFQLMLFSFYIFLRILKMI